MLKKKERKKENPFSFLFQLTFHAFTLAKRIACALCACNIHEWLHNLRVQRFEKKSQGKKYTNKQQTIHNKYATDTLFAGNAFIFSHFHVNTQWQSAQRTYSKWKRKTLEMRENKRKWKCDRIVIKYSNNFNQFTKRTHGIIHIQLQW